jgi:hypothetical protein
MPLLVILASVWMIARPAETARGAILRCFWPIGIYLVINHNLFSWYALWLLPLIALDLAVPRQPRFNAALAWWVFTGTVALSYTFFIRWEEEAWSIHLQFWPLYLLLTTTALIKLRNRLKLPPLSLMMADRLVNEHERSTFNP